MHPQRQTESESKRDRSAIISTLTDLETEWWSLSTAT